MRLNIKSVNADEFSRQLRDAVKGLRNTEPVMKQVLLLGKRAVQRNFPAQKNSDGTDWPRLKYRKGTPLVDKLGRMPKGITGIASKNRVILAAGSATAAYNAVHNFGSKKWHSSGKKKGVPQREYMFLSVQAVAEILKEVSNFVGKLLKVQNATH